MHTSLPRCHQPGHPVTHIWVPSSPSSNSPAAASPRAEHIPRPADGGEPRGFSTAFPVQAAATGTSSHGITEPQNHGITEPQSHGITEPQNRGIPEPQSHGITESLNGLGWEVPKDLPIPTLLPWAPSPVPAASPSKALCTCPRCPQVKLFQAPSKSEVPRK